MRRRFTVNLAPADLPKDGGRFDLAIALGILVSSGQLEAEHVKNCEFVAELALSGACCPVQGVMPSLAAARADGARVFVARVDMQYAALLCGAQIFGVRDLLELVQHLREPSKYQLSGSQSLQCEMTGIESTNLVHGSDSALSSHSSALLPDMSDVIGQYSAKHALEIAAAGAHNLLFYGPPGTGKSMLASRLISILPSLTQDQAMKVASLYTLTQKPRAPDEWYFPPFRSPHHSSSAVALIGGGAKLKPGEVSLAHFGALFLDELTEFSRHALEMLREPLETGEVSISRAQQQVTLPANFQLVAAMNPCPCGYLGHPSIPCTDTPQQIEQYRRKLSGPLLDRIDMHVEVPFQSARLTLNPEQKGETSEQIRERVARARERQIARQSCLNSQLTGASHIKTCTHPCGLCWSGSNCAGAPCSGTSLSSAKKHASLGKSRSTISM